MLNIPNFKTNTYSILLLITLFFSCNNNAKTTENKTNIDKINSELESKISFKTVAILNETNQKIIDIASIAFNNSKELKELQIILKIKKDHQKMESDLKKIADKNLIIIPEPIFQLDLNQDFLKGVNSSYYLISLLEKEINNQINVLDLIEKTAKDEEFKNFADQSKKTLLDNNLLLEILL